MESNSCKFFTSQFSKRHVFLEPEVPSILAKCQGQGECSTGAHYGYVCYRCVVCLWWFIIMCLTFQELSAEYFVFLTHWGVILLAISTSLQLSATIYQFVQEKRDKADEINKKTPLLYKINWVVYNTASVVALIVTLVYYSAIGGGGSFIDVTEHALISIYVIGDAYITGIPVRLLHCWHTIVFLVAYVAITVFYWASTGKGIYEIIDYGENPDLSAVSVTLIALLGVPLMHTALFFLYWTRVLIWTYGCTREQEQLPPKANVYKSQTTNGISNSTFKAETAV